MNLATLILAAAPPPAPDAARAAIEVQSVWDFLLKGGPVMIPIGLCSLIALAVVIERVVTLRRRRVIPPAFLPGLRKVLATAPGNRAKALEYCRAHPSPLARILAAGMKRLGEPVEVMEKHIEEAGQREVIKLRKHLRVLAVIGSVATLLGLLGTITGMISAFQTVAASGEALGRTELLAKGIYEAMITTAAGLIVAIPVQICYHWLTAKVERLVFDMDTMTVELLESLAPGAVPTAVPGPHASAEGASGEQQLAAPGGPALAPALS